PLRHLLMIQFLGCTAESFFAHFRKQQAIRPVIHEPFGAGPYPCLNPACKFFRQPVIGEIIIKQNVDTYYLPTGFFTCSCGYSYARRGPDGSPDDQLRYDWVKSYGSVWAASLKEMWVNQKISIIEMARRLKCCHPNIVNKAINLGLPHPRCARGEKLNRCDSSSWWKRSVKAGLLSNPAEQKEEKLRLTNVYREQLLSAVRQQPEASRTMLRKSAVLAYEWLLEHDQDWLTQHLPPPRQPGGPRREADWAGRDARPSPEGPRAAARLNSSH